VDPPIAAQPGFDDSFDQSNRIDLSELKKLFVGSSAAILRHR
jgi:hypothetical protein